jgi:hypothetical protein
MAKEGYYIKSKSDNQLIFSGGKDINYTILILSFLILVIGGFLYYLLSKTHTITLNFVNIAEDLEVSVVGITKQSRIIAENFEENLMTFNLKPTFQGYSIKEIKCPRCSSALDYHGDTRFFKCKFCGASLSINELRK